MQEVFEKTLERLEEELELADKEKERCVKENHVQFDSAKGYANGVAIAIEIVKQAAEQFGTDTNVGSNGWIPCSERLPENDCHCLVTTSDMEIGIREYGYSKGFGWDGFERIIAWQPLPQPYQPKGE